MTKHDYNVCRIVQTLEEIRIFADVSFPFVSG